MSQQMPPPPMSPMPYSNAGMVPTRTSAAAVTSLICGVLGCLIVTGIVAVITGIIGLKATRDPNVRGRGMAIAGIILGILTTLGASGCLVAGGGGYYLMKKQAAPAIAATDGAMKAIANGDVDGAMKFFDPTSVTRDEVETMVTKLKPLGVPSGVTMMGVSVDGMSGQIDVRGVTGYPGGMTKQVHTVAKKQSDGTAIIESLQVN